MKNVYYSIQYKSNNNTYSKMDQYLDLELANKEASKLNKESDKYTYFAGLEVDDIANEYTYKGFYIIKTKKGFNGTYYKVFKIEDGKRTYLFWSLTLKAAKLYVNKKILSGRLFDWQKDKKSYKPYSVSNLIIEKVWNNGNGSLALFKLLPEEKKIKVNSSLATKRDIEKIKAFNEMEGLNFDLVFSSYSYPEYYSHSF